MIDGDKLGVSLDRLEKAPPPANGSDHPAIAEETVLPSKGADYVLDKILAHRQLPDGPLGVYEYLVRWLGYANPTWEPTRNLRHSQIVRYCKRARAIPPTDLGAARRG